MVQDEEFVQGLARCKELGALAQVHCENGDAVAQGQKNVFESGITGPEVINPATALHCRCCCSSCSGFSPSSRRCPFLGHP